MIKKILLISAVICTHLFLLINTTFTLWPEMVVYPYLLNNNFLLYQDIINPYTPFFIQFLKYFSNNFGYQPLPYQLLTWSIILITDILVFIYSLKISKKYIRAFFSTLLFVFISVPFSINGLWFDLVQTPIIIISIYFFLLYHSKRKNQNLLFASVFIAIAFFTKQQAIWLIIIYLLILILKKNISSTKRLLEISILCLPLLVFFTAEFLFFKLHNISSEFIYWAFYFPFIKSSHLPGYYFLPNLKQLLIMSMILLIFLPTLIDKKSPKHLFLFGMSLFLFAFPRFDYFHLISALSVLTIYFSTIKFDFKKQQIISQISIICILLIIVFCMKFYIYNWGSKVRFFDQETQIVASLIKFIGSPSPIYIQNGPDQIYPLSKTLPVKPWADEFPWYLEDSNIQNRVIDALKKENPKIILFQPYSHGSKFDLGAYRPQKIADYLDDNYQSVRKITDNLILKVRK